MPTRTTTSYFTLAKLCYFRSPIFLKYNMLLLRTLAVWLFVACLAQQVFLSSGKGEGKGRKGSSGKSEHSPGPSPNRTERAATKGKFSTKDKLQCTWAARGEETVTLAVNCKNPEAQVTGGVTELRCNYNAKPTTCPGFSTNPAGYWKQVARALKKLQRRLCQDESALIRAGMCKRATPDAHFKLNVGSVHSVAHQPTDTVNPETTPRTKAKSKSKSTTTKTTTTTTTSPKTRDSKGTSCTERVDQQKLAEEYCSDSWASLCTLLFSMFQSGDC